MVQRRCCCKGKCTCQHCDPASDVACCIKITVGSVNAYAFWGPDCRWKGDGWRVEFTATELRATSPSLTTYAGPRPQDCKNFSVSIGGATFASTKVEWCGECKCQCEFCGGDPEETNTVCCWRLIQEGPGGGIIANLSGPSQSEPGQPCIWEAKICGDYGEESNVIKLSTDANETILSDFSGQLAYLPYTIPCCPDEGVQIGGYLLIPVPPEECGLLEGAWCATVEVFNVGDLPDCAGDCGSFNRVMRPSGASSNALYWSGSMCTPEEPYEGYGERILGAYRFMRVDANDPSAITAVLALDPLWTGGLTWLGSVDLNDNRDHYILYPQVQAGWPECDWSKAYMKVTPGPKCGPCLDQSGCLECINPCPCVQRYNCDGTNTTSYTIRVPWQGYGAPGWGPGEDEVFVLQPNVLFQRARLDRCDIGPTDITLGPCSGFGRAWRLRMEWYGTTNQRFQLADHLFYYDYGDLPCPHHGLYNIDCESLYNQAWPFNETANINGACGTSWNMNYPVTIEV